MKVISDQGKFVQKAQVTITLDEAVNRSNTLVRLGHQTSRTDEEDYPGLSLPKDGSTVSGQEQELATAEVTDQRRKRSRRTPRRHVFKSTTLSQIVSDQQAQVDIIADTKKFLALPDICERNLKANIRLLRRLDIGVDASTLRSYVEAVHSWCHWGKLSGQWGVIVIIGGHWLFSRDGGEALSQQRPRLSDNECLPAISIASKEVQGSCDLSKQISDTCYAWVAEIESVMAEEVRSSGEEGGQVEGFPLPVDGSTSNDKKQ
ncbi:uncharacterized protein PAC_16751 [Phialocephala subalpina]|uniref:Uncharacterized protein n=1 Tax=Phialocephala subalpina TaxID=576137 RepID=A0A1L7XP72_9HELO|nr:uncharacterized protein PAC_16751 [Phialocephala subalpina]